MHSDKLKKQKLPLLLSKKKKQIKKTEKKKSLSFLYGLDTIPELKHKHGNTARRLFSFVILQFHRSQIFTILSFSPSIVCPSTAPVLVKLKKKISRHHH